MQPHGLAKQPYRGQALMGHLARVLGKSLECLCVQSPDSECVPVESFSFCFP